MGEHRRICRSPKGRNSQVKGLDADCTLERRHSTDEVIKQENAPCSQSLSIFQVKRQRKLIIRDGSLCFFVAVKAVKMYIFIMILEIIGTIAFALSGAVAGLKKGMDLLGVVVLGTTTAVGGGILRDIILGITPPAAFCHPKYAIIAILSSAIVFFLRLKKISAENSRLYDIFFKITDSIGLGIFTVCGMDVAIKAGFQAQVFLLIFVGVITGVGGGVIRDVLAGDTPYIFLKHFYASAAIIGAVIFKAMSFFLPQDIALLIGLTVIIALRLCSIKFEWNLPRVGKDM